MTILIVFIEPNLDRKQFNGTPLITLYTIIRAISTTIKKINLP